MNNVLLWFLALVSLSARAADFEMVSLRDGTQLPPSGFYGGSDGMPPPLTIAS